MADTSLELVGGRYRVLGSLGKGAMGCVYMAHDPVLDRKVAIKQMTAEIADNEELRQRFYVEARAAARLNHPNIITIHELQEFGGEIFMVMELLEGKPLSALIQAKPVPLSLEATLDVMAQVCEGLDYAHQRAIVHRDIKPANLFLTPSGAVKVLDFGIARLGSLHMTVAGAIIGTPDYMSPEQVRGDEIDRRTDLWAVGAVLYQLLSGAKPFEGRPLARLLAAISQTPHIPLQQRAPAVPKSVSDLVDRLLSKPRDARPASAGIVRDELRAVLGRSATAAAKARLVEDEYSETVFMATPGGPAPPPAAPPPSVPAAPASRAPSAAAATPTVTSVPDTVQTVARTAHMAATQAEGPAATVDATLPVPDASPAPPPVAPLPSPIPRPPVATASVAPPAYRARVPVPAPAPAAVPSPVPEAPARRGSRVLVTVLVIMVIGFFGLATVAGVGWWYLNRKGMTVSGWLQGLTGQAASSQASSEAASTTSTPGGSVGAGTGATPPATVTGAEATPARPTAADPQSPTTPETQPPISTPPRVAPSAPPPQVETPAAVPPPSARGTARGAAVVPSSPPPAESPATPPAAAAGTKAPPPEPRRGGPPVETGVSRADAPRQGLTQDTVEALSGRRSGQAYDAPQAPSTIAAVNRINYVLEQYIQALVRADAEAIKEFRPALSAEESGLMRARQLKVRLSDVRVDVSGTDATARCRRVMEGVSAFGTPIHEDGSVVFRFVRRPSGWVITAVQ